MKTLAINVTRLALVSLAFAALTACESTEPKKPKPVPPTAGIDEKPWNRPHSWENNARYGNMLPQGR